MLTCAVLDIILGVVVIILQVIFLALGYIGIAVYAMSGFWGGVIFIATGGIALSNGSHLNKNKIVNMTGVSIVVGIFMACFYLWLASYFFDGSCSRFRLCEGFYIEIGFILSGILAIIINAVMIIQARKLTPNIVPQPQSPYNYPSSNIIIVNEPQQPYSISAGYNAKNPSNRNEVPKLGGIAPSSNTALNPVKEN